MLYFWQRPRHRRIGKHIQALTFVRSCIRSRRSLVRLKSLIAARRMAAMREKEKERMPLGWGTRERLEREHEEWVKREEQRSAAWKQATRREINRCRLRGGTYASHSGPWTVHRSLARFKAISSEFGSISFSESRPLTLWRCALAVAVRARSHHPASGRLNDRGKLFRSC